MFINILKFFFAVICIIYPALIILHKLYICKIKDNMKKSDFIAFLAIILGLYIITSLILIIFAPRISYKFIMVLFAISPFIIGKIATYKTEFLFSIIQILVIVTSSVFVILYF